MAKVIMICGKICSGKSTYARALIAREKAVLLSVDEIMLSMFGLYCGDMHDEYAARTEKYLLDKSLEILASGIDVVLDWGVWRKAQRARIREFYRQRNIPYEMRLMEISDEEWLRRIEKRNAAVQAGDHSAYFIDENLARKFENAFEAPDADEIDVIVNDRYIP